MNNQIVLALAFSNCLRHAFMAGAGKNYTADEAISREHLKAFEAYKMLDTGCFKTMSDHIKNGKQPVTIDQAKAIMAELSNGVVEGMNAGKNGRAWLSGEFQLCELEALCVLVRAVAGDNAEGAAELIENNPDVWNVPVPPTCDHNGKWRAAYDHHDCLNCGAFKTDNGTSWGVAGNKTFKSRSEAEFYRQHGRLPE